MIARALAWCAGFLALHAALCALTWATVAEDHRAAQLDRRFLERDAPISVLVAGASHARNGVAADELGGLSIAVAGEHIPAISYGSVRARVWPRAKVR